MGSSLLSRLRGFTACCPCLSRRVVSLERHVDVAHQPSPSRSHASLYEISFVRRLLLLSSNGQRFEISRVPGMSPSAAAHQAILLSALLSRILASASVARLLCQARVFGRRIHVFLGIGRLSDELGLPCADRLIAREAFASCERDGTSMSKRRDCEQGRKQDTRPCPHSW